MLRNFLKTALRNLWKHKLFSFINIFGLASGMLVCLLAMIDIKGAFEYDSFHPHPDRTYRILTDVTARNNDEQGFATSPMPLAQALKQDYPFVEEATRVIRNNGDFTANRKQLPVIYSAVDPGFFKIFGFRLAKGQATIAPQTVVLTQKTAKRFFGTANPIGKTMEHPELGALTITGVFAEPVAKSHLNFDALVSMATFSSPNWKRSSTDWKTYSRGYTYVLLKANTPVETLDGVLPKLAGRVTKDVRFTTEKGYTFRSQSLAALSPSREELMYSTYEPTAGKLETELGVGLLTLLLAAFNYINLTLARSLSRAREVGIRKVAGALRWQLMGQFMAESAVLSLLGLGLAYGMLQLVKPMPFVQQWLIGGVQWEGDTRMWLIFITFSVATGLLAGLLPARVLSGFQPAQVLRSQTGLRVFRGITLRKSLIVAQFSISLFAMIALLALARQQHFMGTADYGFQRKDVFVVPLNGFPAGHLSAEINRLAGVERVAATSTLFGDHGGGWQVVRRQQAKSDSAQAHVLAADANLVPVTGLKLLAGKNLPTSVADSSSRFVLINEEAVRSFRLGEAGAAVGQTLWLNDSTEVRIAGVLKDFQFTTMAMKISPLVLRYQPQQFRYLNVKVAGGNHEAIHDDIARIWKRLNPYEPFAGVWYDDFLSNRNNISDDVSFMALLIGLAVAIACLGLLGMVTYTTELRTKEVGVRKVMGARVDQVVWLLSWDFLKLLLIAGAIALPLGYLAASFFLMTFAYHVSIGVGTLGLCFGTMLILGALTIGWRTYRTALANPATSLRTE
ncbi:FtsX-like permease family protein [Spirosoma aureum]|uniref:FtsX-like permease family protein n=1 Tax=Spirosoma aureum TaxID=2692134 RepID=A0A6G9AL51_9BACT|nr:ABC transporter permease [Spirosoma aureum]QIP12933.1 FtsX-like permease family protein [Spirosoma aureum]